MYVFGKRVRSGVLILGVVSRGHQRPEGLASMASPVANGKQCLNDGQRGSALRVVTSGRNAPAATTGAPVKGLPDLTVVDIVA